MAVSHVVQRGEYLSMIALKHGFHDHRILWDHPDNAALKQRRRNPNTLLEGDVIAVPERRVGELTAETGKVTVFRASANDAALNVHLESPARKPLANRDVVLTFGGILASGAFAKAKPLTLTSDAAGRVHQLFIGAFAERASATEAELAVLANPKDPPAEFRLIVGALAPVDEPAGQRARLDNLGYFAGYTEGDRDQLEWATEEFQCDEKLKERGLFEERARNLPTWNHLAKKHGDMLPGEELK